MYEPASPPHCTRAIKVASSGSKMCATSANESVRDCERMGSGYLGPYDPSTGYCCARLAMTGDCGRDMVVLGLDALRNRKRAKNKVSICKMSKGKPVEKNSASAKLWLPFKVSAPSVACLTSANTALNTCKDSTTQTSNVMTNKIKTILATKG